MESSNENERVEDEEACGQVICSTIIVSSDWVNRNDYVLHIYWVQILDYEIPDVMTNFRDTGL